MDIRTSIGYLNPEIRTLEDGLTVRLGNKEQRHKVTVKKEVTMYDARPLGCTLDRNGVTMIPFRSACKDYYDADEIKHVLYPEVAAAAKKLFGAEHSICYQHGTRSEDPVAEGKRSGRGTFTHAYARFAHLDCGPNSGVFARNELRRQLGLSEEETAERRMDVVMANFWKPRDYPVAQNPLAVLDDATIDYDAEIVPTIFVSTGPDGTTYESKICQLRESGRHRWLYWPKLAVDEALVFKQMDTRPGVARHGFHTSFDDPTAPPDAPGRRSIELTVVLGFPKPAAASL